MPLLTHHAQTLDTLKNLIKYSSMEALQSILDWPIKHPNHRLSEVLRNSKGLSIPVECIPWKPEASISLLSPFLFPHLYHKPLQLNTSCWLCLLGMWWNSTLFPLLVFVYVCFLWALHNLLSLHFPDLACYDIAAGWRLMRMAIKNENRTKMNLLPYRSCEPWNTIVGSL